MLIFASRGENHSLSGFRPGPRPVDERRRNKYGSSLSIYAESVRVRSEEYHSPVLGNYILHTSGVVLNTVGRLTMIIDVPVPGKKVSMTILNQSMSFHNTSAVRKHDPDNDFGS